MIVVGSDSEVCSNLTTPETFESPLSTATREIELVSSSKNAVSIDLAGDVFTDDSIDSIDSFTYSIDSQNIPALTIFRSILVCVCVFYLLTKKCVAEMLRKRVKRGEAILFK